MASNFSSQAGLEFLQILFNSLVTTKGDRQALYRLCNSHLHLLNMGLIPILQTWTKTTFTEEDPELTESAAHLLYQLGLLISQFPQGNPKATKEIAIKSYQLALTGYQSHNYPLRAQTQYALGNAYSDRLAGNKRENSETAIQCYQRALTHWTETKFPREWAKAQYALGNAYLERLAGDKTANLETAIQYYQKALKYRTEATVPLKWAMTKYALGNAYSERIEGDRGANLETAIQYYHSALKYRTEATVPLEWAMTQYALGNAYSERIEGDRGANLETAIQYYHSALKYRTEATVPLEWAMTQYALGNAYLARLTGDKGDNIETALQYYHRALKYRTEATVPLNWARTQYALGNAYSERRRGDKRQNITKAIECYQKALTKSTASSDPYQCLMVARALGNLSFKHGKWEIAITAYQQAIESIEQIRQQELEEQATAIYANMVESQIELGRYSQALEYVERSKARNLVELLATKNLYPKGSIPPAILEQLDHLRQSIRLEQRHLEIARSENSNRLPASASISPLPQLQQELDNLIIQHIKPIDPTFSLTQKVEPISLAQIQSLIPNERTVIVEWYFTEQLIHTFLITNHPNQPVTLHSTPQAQKLKEFSEQYLQTYTDKEQKVQWSAKLPQLLQELATILDIEIILEKLFTLLPQCQGLILIPHRFLHIFPLHALLPLESFPQGISYGPSCQVLLSLKHFKDDHGEQFLAIQNPTQDLDYSDLEVQSIGQFYDEAEVLHHQQATKDAVINQPLANKHYLHFSCHAYFNFNQPLQSALILADCQLPPPPPETDSHRYLYLGEKTVIDLSRCLTLTDIFDLDLRQCHLVTLSACETGIVDVLSKSDQYIGLPSAFLYAGTSAVVTSLWVVSDRATALLMIRFYQLFHDSQNSLTYHQGRLALYQAQLWLARVTVGELTDWARQLPSSGSKRALLASFSQLDIHEQPFQAPHYWAAFRYIGL